MTATTAPTDAAGTPADFYRYLILDRTDLDQCSWALAIPVDKQSFPALLDEHGRPGPGEVARAMNTASNLLGYPIYLQAVFGTRGLVHRVLVPLPQPAQQHDRPADAEPASAA